MAQQQRTQALKGIDEKLDILLARLDKVKRTGDGKWLACCPAHEDKSPSLGIKIGSNGGIILYCFGGCDVESILASIGLDFQDLFPDKERVSYKKETYPKFSRYEVFPQVIENSMILFKYIDEANQGIPHKLKDLTRVYKAMAEIHACAREVGFNG